MKLYDFGLWFVDVISEEWSTTIPQTGCFSIRYDGNYLGVQYSDFVLQDYNSRRFTIKLKNKFARNGHYYEVGRLLTLDDFEIVPNPDYKGDP